MNAVLNCETHKGPVKIKFSSLPPLLYLYVSNVVSDPDEKNASWIFKSPKMITLDPCDLHAKNKNHFGKVQHEPFKQLYFKFVSEIDCKFSADIYFPDELEHDKNNEEKYKSNNPNKSFDLLDFRAKRKVISVKEEKI